MQTLLIVLGKLKIHNQNGCIWPAFITYTGSIDYIWQAKIHNPKTCIHWKSQAQWFIRAKITLQNVKIMFLKVSRCIVWKKWGMHWAPKIPLTLDCSREISLLHLLLIEPPLYFSNTVKIHSGYTAAIIITFLMKY